MNKKYILAALLATVPVTYYVSSEYIFTEPTFEEQTKTLYLCLEAFDSLHKYNAKTSVLYLVAKEEIEDVCGVTYEEVYNVNTTE